MNIKGKPRKFALSNDFVIPATIESIVIYANNVLIVDRWRKIVDCRWMFLTYLRV